MEASGFAVIAVIEDNERLIPVGGYVDAVGGTVDESYLGEASRRLEQLRPGGLARWSGSAHGERRKEKDGCKTQRSAGSEFRSSRT